MAWNKPTGRRAVATTALNPLALLGQLSYLAFLLPLVLLIAAGPASATATAAVQQYQRDVVKPKVPLFSTGRWIVDSDSARVKFRCINWAGHMEVNIPEGLDKQPVESIADWVAKEGFNCVRLTYSTDMTRNFTLSVKDSFKAAAVSAEIDEAQLMALYEMAVIKNPFLANATVIDVFDRTASALWDRGVMTILDNHISRAGWCCDLTDGNGWWSDAPIYSSDNSRYFDSAQWLTGLKTMADWAIGHEGIVAFSLRNEMRATITQIAFASGTWYQKMEEAARVVHEANPDMLVIVGGLNGGTDLMPLRSVAMDTSGWAGKNVWEAHVYTWTPTTFSFGICALLQSQIGGLFGFVLEQNQPYTGPLFLSEFGVGMTDGPNDGLNDESYAYLTCLVQWLESNDADWALWAIQGSYYVRQGRVNVEESWGAVNFNWTEWRNPKFRALLGSMFEVTQGP
jgi:endoglucanase